MSYSIGWLWSMQPLQRHRSLLRIQFSEMSVSKLLIILPLNVGFENEVWWGKKKWSMSQALEVISQMHSLCSPPIQHAQDEFLAFCSTVCYHLSHPVRDLGAGARSIDVRCLLSCMANCKLGPKASVRICTQFVKISHCCCCC